MGSEEEKEINLVALRGAWRVVVHISLVAFIICNYWEDILEWIISLPGILKGW